MATRKFENIFRRPALVDTFEATARSWWDSGKAARSDSHSVYAWRRLAVDVFLAIG